MGVFIGFEKYKTFRLVAYVFITIADIYWPSSEALVTSMDKL